jgi:hypothetical protein
VKQRSVRRNQNILPKATGEEKRKGINNPGKDQENI